MDVYEMTAEELYGAFYRNADPHNVINEGRNEIAARLQKEHKLKQEPAYYAADEILAYAQELLDNRQATQQEQTHQPAQSEQNGALQPGSKAPDFTLPSTRGEDQQISLSDFKGKPVVLVFYPADWSPVCGDQIALYNEVLPTFEEYDAAVLGISVDNIYCHQAYADSLNIRFALLSDFEPKGAVAREYGVYAEETGMTERALFVIDSEGIIRWQEVSQGGIDAPNPGADGILNALVDLKV
jgi:peroxiredoxin